MDSMLTGTWRPLIERERNQNDQVVGLADILAFARIHKWTIASGLLIGIALAWFYAATTPESYIARTQILIDPRLQQLPQQPAEVNLSLDTAQIESQIAVLRSEKIMSMVIDRLNLMGNAEFILSGPPTFRARTLKIIDMLPPAIGEHLAGVRAMLAEDDPLFKFMALPEDQRRRVAIETLGDYSSVGRVGVSYAIDIGARMTSRELAADIANAIADSYVREQIDTRAASAKEGVAWLERRLGELRRQMNRATAVAQQYRSRHDFSVEPFQGADSAGGAADSAPSVDSAPSADSADNGDVEQAAKPGLEPAEPTLEELETTAETYRKMYESFLAAFTNSVSQQSYQVADARVITYAMPPLQPSEPRKKLILLFGALAGLVFGTGIAFLRWTLDGTVRTAKTIRDELGLECIGELPLVGRRRGGFARLNEVSRYPNSAYANSVRGIRSAINLYEPTKGVRTVGVVSAMASDGKSTSAANICISYAQSGSRVLLVDADVGNAFLSNALMSSQLLLDRAPPTSVREFVVRSEKGEFDILSSRFVSLQRMLSPARMKEALDELKLYDVIVVDLPPLESGVDNLAMASAVDGVVVFAEWGVTPVEQVARVVRALHAHKASVIGIAITNVGVPSLPAPRSRRGSRPR